MGSLGNGVSAAKVEETAEPQVRERAIVDCRVLPVAYPHRAQIANLGYVMR